MSICFVFWTHTCANLPSAKYAIKYAACSSVHCLPWCTSFVCPNKMHGCCCSWSERKSTQGSAFPEEYHGIPTFPEWFQSIPKVKLHFTVAFLPRLDKNALSSHLLSFLRSLREIPDRCLLSLLHLLGLVIVFKYSSKCWEWYIIKVKNDDHCARRPITSTRSNYFSSQVWKTL